MANQKIGCKVTECAFHKKDACSLESIMVFPGAKEHSADPEEASMCGSFKKSIH